MGQGRQEGKGTIKKKITILFIIIFYFLAAPHGMWDFPDQGSNPCPPAVEAWSLNPWTAREVRKETILVWNKHVLLRLDGCPGSSGSTMRHEMWVSGGKG